MIEPNNPILSKMLDRLFAAMLNGPSMNCRGMPILTLQPLWFERSSEE